MSKKKVAVLGGGIASLTAAYYLTSTQDLRDKHDVTIYQTGWRLGGKGASGRNLEAAHRIEEHGLHIWMGFYENAIRLMREIFEQAERDESIPLRTFDEAFKPHSYIVLQEKIRDLHEWWPWTFNFPRNEDRPGEGSSHVSVSSAVTMIMQWMLLFWFESPYASELELNNPEGFNAIQERAKGILDGVILSGRDRIKSLFIKIPMGAVTSEQVISALEFLLKAASALPDSTSSRYGKALLVPALTALDQLLWRMLEPTVYSNPSSHQLWVSMNLASAALRGILTDSIAHAGWDSIDRHDLREWLAIHGANQITVDSAPIRGVYDLAFGYVGGDIRRNRFAAGTAMRGMLRMLFSYKGSIFYKMQAGMGDVVFAPMYEVLRKRGVKFRFFHKITNLSLSSDGRSVETIQGQKQVKLRGAEYEPLYCTPDGLPCWPNKPLFDQIIEGEELRASGIDLESNWAKPWKQISAFSLKRGQDFDDVVLGISIGAFPYVAPELIAANNRFRLMCEKVCTVNTQALQLWLKPSLEGLGWKRPPNIKEAPVLGAFVEPIDTWADMDQLLTKEFWPQGHEPKSVAYFCGPYDGEAPIPSFQDHTYPDREKARYHSMVRNFLERDIRGIWPSTVHNSQGFNWDLLVDPEERQGPDRLESQYIRVNIDPSERYVLSVPGSTQYRLSPGDSGFDNVVLAGDWTYNVVNAGCIEAAVSSGMGAARAICGYPQKIIGELVNPADKQPQSATYALVGELKRGNSSSRSPRPRHIFSTLFRELTAVLSAAMWFRPPS